MRKVVWFSRLLKKGKDSFCKEVFEKEWNKCEITGRKRKQWKKCVFDIISDMDLTFSSLGSKEAVSSINNAFKIFVISSLQSGMCKNKLRVCRELTEDFKCKKYLHGVSDMGSKLLFRFRSGTHGLNEELGRHSSRNSSKAGVFCECECESVEHVLWECSEYSSIRKEFIGNLDGFLQNHFHLKSSLILIRLNIFLIRVFGNVMVTLIIGFQILRLFCVAYGICTGRNFILQVHLI